MKIDFPTSNQIPELKKLWQTCFGDETAFVEGFFSTVFSPRRCRCVTVDGRLAAALYWFDCRWQENLCAYLYAIATDPAFRGQGLCTALMADTHGYLAKKGYAGTVLVPGNKQLFSFYEKQGYRPFGGKAQLSCAPETPVALRPVTAEEYAAARRKYLPADGVIQEGENLTFLQTQAELYVGEDFVLAATKDGDCLRGIELLGNLNAAGGIVSALGAKLGIFSVPGEKPFAMCRSLRDPFSPAYFGLAFD